MMLRTIDNEFIEVPDVEMERQAKLFQNIGDTAGDFSYSFEIDNNSENRRKLGIVSIVDGFDKSIYRISDLDLCDDNGAVVYSGYIQVQGITDVIEMSFFSGNNNWFSAMSGKIADLNLTSYEVDINKTSIPGTWANTSGVIFPILDAGSISNRSTNNWITEDFHPLFYVKDAVSECFKQSGLKLAGSLLTERRYSKLATTNNSDDTQQIKDRSIFVAKSSTQSISEATWDKVTFGDVTGVNYPGLLWDTVNNKFVADVKMTIKISLTTVVDVVNGPGFSNYLIFNLSVDGFQTFAAYTDAGLNKVVTYNGIVTLNEGEELTIVARRTQPLGTAAIDSGSLKIEPTKLFKVFVNNILPNTTQVEFVTSVFKLFNTVVSYDHFTKTVTVDLFKNIVRQDELDISEYVDPSTIRINYTEMLESYGRNNVLLYTEPSFETIERYNLDNPYPFGAGVIESNNDFLEENVNILESIFSPSTMSPRNPLGVNIPELGFTEENEESEVDATVTNDSGNVKITITDGDFNPLTNQIINIKSSTNNVYKGQYIISIIHDIFNFNIYNLPFVSNETIVITRSTIKRTSNNSQILLLVNAEEPYANWAPDFSSIAIEDTTESDDPAIAWFYRTMDGNAMDAEQDSLSFGSIDIKNAYQRTMIDDYWQDLESILQDPIKVYADFNLPKPVFESITFKQPLRLKTDRFNARFFPNRITGYKDSSQPCTKELIKLP